MLVHENTTSFQIIEIGGVLLEGISHDNKRVVNQTME